ncbi:hypothetical protein CCACVL1_26497 [Corchorus capsularis]|uniref:Uncharacterized protein n=1 Tax=Corchorus capsularis TaxID=210143 RepID=A0A1R3GEQ5_COCAP|nr:hypothetical protein CCACVL1_26497 [Corchorus capsularis]
MGPFGARQRDTRVIWREAAFGECKEA